MRDTPAKKEAMAVVVQTEAGRDAHGPRGRKIPGQNRGEIVRGVTKPKAVTVSEPAVHLDTSGKLLAAERTALSGGFEGERAAGAESIAELPGVIVDVFHRDHIFGEIPASTIAGKNQL